MKRITASEARRQWFRLLDEVIEGEVVAIIRKGKRIIIRRENATRGVREPLPDYGSILKVRDAEQADTWGWDWHGPETDVTPARREP
ncbi:MAG: hypothetical protein ACT4O1_15150 [Gemmatimonadota bacterium]